MKIALRAYDALWRLLPPLLKRNARLREGFAQRMLQTPLPHAALWLHAASAGESYLAESIAQALVPFVPEGARLHILATTNTRQGHDILTRAGDRLTGSGAVFRRGDRGYSREFHARRRPFVSAAGRAIPSWSVPECRARRRPGGTGPGPAPPARRRARPLGLSRGGP